ncbi:MAG: diguanylate cyclase [Planctomycetota bacterium]|nr:diguanylate cyclase [Planctomycetota bacterium]
MRNAVFGLEDSNLCFELGKKLAENGVEVESLESQHEQAVEQLRLERGGLLEVKEERACLRFQVRTLLAFADILQEDWRMNLGIESREQLELLRDTAGIGTWSWDLQTRDFQADQRFHLLHGYVHWGPVVDHEDQLRRLHPADVECVTKATLNLLVEDKPLAVAYRILHPDRSCTHVSLRANLVRDAEGVPQRLYGVCLDITENCRVHQELEELSRSDPLTGVLNRRGLTSSLECDVERRRKFGNEVQALFIDLDDFKSINDVYGHSVGDATLQRVSDLLRNIVRSTDYVARIGGDEFLVILPNTTHDEAMPVARKISSSIENMLISTKFPHLRVGASVGLVSAAFGDDMVQNLLVRAERALHSAKRLGKGQIFHEDSLFESSDERPHSFNELLAELNDPASYFAVRQPLVSAHSLEVLGYEFLARSRCEVLKSPEDFLRFAMDAGVANIVDAHAFATCAAAAHAVPAELQCHLNLLPSTLENGKPEQWLRCLPSNRDLGSFCIEISEKESVRHPQRLLKNVKELRAAGVRVALDDVGYGHSSLEALLLLEPEVVKVDRMMVRGITKGCDNYRAFRNLLKVVRTWGGEVVAEGVERQQELEVLLDLGVNKVQGFLFGQPE